jgi:hypothetical protein
LAWSVAADLVMLVHFTFVVFAILGGLAVLIWPRLAWFHLPVLIYGIAIELVGWVCPLTPLEWEFRSRAGQAGIEGGFMEHYLGPILYPANWEDLHLWLGILLLLFNVAVYAGVWLRHGPRAADNAGGRPADD